MRTISVLLLALALLGGCRMDDPTPADLRGRIDSIAGWVESIRGIRFREPVQGRYVRRGDLLRVYDSASFEEPDPADSAWDRMLWSLGFVDSLGALDGAADSVDEASILAFYSRGVLWVVDDMRDSADLDVTIAHELVHALQDQRWDLARLYREGRGLDQRLSLQYLLEGEARLIETLWASGIRDAAGALEAFPHLSLEEFRDSLRQGDGLEPELVTLPTFHPYEQGARALAWRWRQGGWDSVDSWFRSVPPTSCFLHPESVCVRPPELDVEGIADLPRGWRPLRDGRVGEHYLNILFSLWRSSSEWIPPGALRAESLLREPWSDPGPDGAVDGWRGDKFRIWRDDAGNLALAWRTMWRDSSAAERFLQSYQRVLVKKQRDDRIVERRPGLGLFRDAEAGVWDRIERFGSEVWIAEGMVGQRPFEFLPQVSLVETKEDLPATRTGHRSVAAQAMGVSGRSDSSRDRLSR